MESSIKILVLDDQPEIREIVSDIIHISYEEIQIDEAESFDVAMKLTEENKYKILLVDINLVGKSGVDFIKEIRGNDSINKNCPILVITGSPSSVEKELEQFENLELFSKVAGIENLTEKIAEILED